MCVYPIQQRFGPPKSTVNNWIWCRIQEPDTVRIHPVRTHNYEFRIRQNDKDPSGSEPATTRSESGKMIRIRTRNYEIQISQNDKDPSGSEPASMLETLAEK
jgi:hypothetical protein